ncbi:Uncharacterized protein OBRU01_10826 [Operophtera brumata]|uniref:Parkin coregulated gene protein-like protein n=1 Tax=Operophtera brumata TaxID=104452 RepID=A0A0L7LCT2_OPEBR|nr:Uncharacterized protein OBRU01_10826 [Operophtera brumata]
MPPVLLPPCTPDICGRDFRNSLLKPSPNYTHGQKPRKVRIVPAFTIQAMQKNTRVVGPPKSGVMDPLPLKPSMFRKSYQRGEFPLTIEFTTMGKRLAWKVPVEKLDFQHYLPMFFDGLSEGTYPFNFIIENGIKDLISKGAHKVLPCVPQLIIPIKKPPGASIDVETTKGENVADTIEETLQILERYGGPDAFINIKYMIPTYEVEHDK